MPEIRPPAVAGSFYPEHADALRALVREQLPGSTSSEACPRALIVPHAGLRYSGATAASAYALLSEHAPGIRRVALFGPAHRVPLSGLAVPTTHQFLTPLGPVNLDAEAMRDLLESGLAQRSDLAHSPEHSLEVQLPFLQTVLESFELIPVLGGEVDADTVARAMERCLDDETLLLVSSDLSHFHSYERGRELDRDTCDAILAGDTALSGEQACGCRLINGLNLLSRKLGWRRELLQLCSSGDTGGPRDRVVGYAAFALYATD